MRDMATEDEPGRIKKSPPTLVDGVALRPTLKPPTYFSGNGDVDPAMRRASVYGQLYGGEWAPVVLAACTFALSASCADLSLAFIIEYSALRAYTRAPPFAGRQTSDRTSSTRV
jgi:hypothetical protein